MKVPAAAAIALAACASAPKGVPQTEEAYSKTVLAYLDRSPPDEKLRLVLLAEVADPRADESLRRVAGDKTAMPTLRELAARGLARRVRRTGAYAAGLNDRTEEVRVAVACEVAARPDRSAAPHLQLALADTDRRVRLAAAEALRALGEPAPRVEGKAVCEAAQRDAEREEAFRAHLAAADPEMRRRALRWLIENDSVGSADRAALEPIYADAVADEQTRALAAAGLLQALNERK